MKEIKLYVFPFGKADDTFAKIVIDGTEFRNPDNRLYQFVVKNPLSKWLYAYRNKLFIWKGFFYELALELNASSYHIVFFGSKRDYGNFEKEADVQKKALETDGRNIRFELEFKQFDIRKIVDDIGEAFDNLISKANKDNCHLSSEILDAYNEFRIPCRIVFLNCNKPAEKEVMSLNLLRIDERNPLVSFAVVGTFRTAAAAVCFEDIVAAFVPDTGSRLCFDTYKIPVFVYHADPRKAIRKFLYSVYSEQMDEAISKAIKDIDRLTKKFEDWDSDPFLGENTEKMKKLLDYAGGNYG